MWKCQSIVGGPFEQWWKEKNTSKEFGSVSSEMWTLWDCCLTSPTLRQLALLRFPGRQLVVSHCNHTLFKSSDLNFLWFNNITPNNFDKRRRSYCQQWLSGLRVNWSSHKPQNTKNAVSHLNYWPTKWLFQPFHVVFGTSKLFTVGVYLTASRHKHNGKNRYAQATPPWPFSQSKGSISCMIVAFCLLKPCGGIKYAELWPVNVSETHRKARLKKKHVRLKTGTFHTNAAVSRWPWWETCNQVSLASAILVPHLH